MPRPRKPDAPTASQRAAASRVRRQARTVELPGSALDDAQRIRERDGDASLVGVITRVLREAADRA